MKVSVAAIREIAPSKPPGYQDDVLSRGTIQGDILDITEADYRALAARYAPPRPNTKVASVDHANDIPEPTNADLASNFAGAMVRWVKAGLPVVTRPEYQARASVCDACPHWDRAARLGLGKCSAPGCGCTSLKRWLATEKCPLGRWPA